MVFLSESQGFSESPKQLLLFKYWMPKFYILLKIQIISLAYINSKINFIPMSIFMMYSKAKKGPICDWLQVKLTNSFKSLSWFFSWPTPLAYEMHFMIERKRKERERREQS